MFAERTWIECLLILYGITQCMSCGCPDGWVSFKDSCYLFSNSDNVHFTEAEHYCKQHGGHLVTVETSLENAFLRDYLQRLKVDRYWIGLSDEMIEGVWQWTTDHVSATFTDWAPGEPNSRGPDGEDCAMFWSGHNFHWDDVKCVRDDIKPLCEKR